MFCGQISRQMASVTTYSLHAASYVHRSKTTQIGSSLFGRRLESSHNSLCGRGVVALFQGNANKLRTSSVDTEEMCKALQTKRWHETRRIFLLGPEAAQLYQEVMDAGKFMIKFVSEEQAPTGATVLPKSREIHLNKALTDWGPCLLFALNNLKQAEEIIYINQSMPFLGPEGYLARAQYVEWTSALKSHEIARKCIQRGVWPPTWDCYAAAFTGEPNAAMNWTTIKGFRKTQEETMQANVYRQQWYQTCDPEGLADLTARNLVKWQTRHDNSRVHTSLPVIP